MGVRPYGAAMLRLAANLSLMFGEHSFLERFGAAAEAGFTAVEYHFVDEYAPDALAQAISSHGLTQVLFNFGQGDLAAGERGLGAMPGAEDRFAESLERALHYAEALRCTRLHAMAGTPPPRADPEDCRRVFLENLRLASTAAAAKGIDIHIEPLNTRDNPGYFLTRQAQARDIIEAVGAENLKLQFDFYHCQIMEGDLAEHLRTHADIIGHIQIAGVPGRHEPDVGEINYPYLFDILGDIGYDGWVGCEYVPQRRTIDGLGWMARL